MKKMIRFAALLALVATLLCGCGKFQCDLCGDEKSGKKYTGNLFGQEIVYCKECKEGLEALGNMFD